MMQRRRVLPRALAGVVLPALAVGLCGLVTPTLGGQPADPGATTLPSLVVTASQSPVERLIDRRVYAVAADLQSFSGTAADVLNQVPSVEVDPDGNVSLRGNNKVTILVDGKRSAQLSGPLAGDGLLQFSASEIDKIEVMNNPSAQFKAEGSAGVINIITKKSHKPGASGTLRTSLGNKHRYVIGATGNYNAGRLNLSGGIGLRHDTRERVVESTLAAADPVTNNFIVSQEILDEKLRRQIPSIKAGVDYRLNDHQSVGLSLNFRERSGSRFYDQQDESVVQNGLPVAVAGRHSDGHERNLNSDQTLRFTQVLRQPEETLDLSLHRTSARERENYTYLNAFTLPARPPRVDHLDLNTDLVTTDISVDYATVPSEHTSLKLGYDFEEDRDAFRNSADTIDPATGLLAFSASGTNDFRYLQKVHAGYGTYQTGAEGWNLQGGARIERTAVDTRQVIGGSTSAQRYTRIYPTFHLERMLSEDSTLSMSLSRRISRPEAQALNPFSDRQATHDLRRGNPNLLPQDTRSLDLGYDGVSHELHYDVTAYLRRNRNSVTDVTQLLGADVILTTKANLPNSTSKGIEFTANGRATPKLSYAVSGNLFNSQIDAVALGATGLRSTTGVNVKASLEYRPTPFDTGQLTFSRADKRLTAQGYIGSSNLVNLGYKRQISADFSAVFTVSDIFNGQITRRFVNTPVLTDTYRRIQTGRVFYAGIVYLLGSHKKNKSPGFDYDDERKELP